MDRVQLSFVDIEEVSWAKRMMLPGLDILQVQVLISFLLLEYLDNSNSWIRDISVEFQLVEYDISKVYINWNFYCYKIYDSYFPSKML